MPKFRWIGLLPLLVLAGCASVEKPAPRAAIVLPDNFVFAPSVQDGGAARPDALLPVNDAAFRLLVRRAANAPDLGIALARIETARALAKRAAAERAPLVDASVSAGGERSNPQQFGNIPSGVPVDATRFNIGATISARWDADIFGGLRARERAATLRLDAAGFDAAAVRIALVSEIASAVSDWQNIAAQRAQIDANIAAAQDRATLIRSRVRAGLNPGLDLMRAEALLEAQRAALAPLDADATVIIARLVALTASPADMIRSELGAGDAPWAGGSAPASVPSALIAARPDIQAAAARLAAADADLAATAARRFPNFSLSSAIGLLAFSLGGLFDSDAITGQFGAAIAGPLLDFGRIGADIARDEAEAQTAFEELRKVSFLALGETEQAFGVLAALEKQAALLRAQAQRETEVARISASRNRAGLENLITVLDSDRIAYAARQQAIAAEGRAQRARISLWQSLGGPGVNGILAEAGWPGL